MKKIILRVVACFMMAAMIGTCMGNAGKALAASGDLVITFADLTAGGYGYEATVNGDAVDVSIASQYQEIQYVLPEVVDLAAYTTLVVDVTSNAQLDVKLVDPNAELNEYSQLAPFLDYYTDGAVSSPISIDLATYADKDLSQINFMAMGNDTTFTIKSITFVNPVQETPAEEPAEEPAETPAEEPAEEPAETPTEEPAEEPAETPAETTGEETVYTVQKGDCLWNIAKKFLGKGARYVEIFERNSDIIEDATIIKAGQKLVIPAK